MEKGSLEPRLTKIIKVYVHYCTDGNGSLLKKLSTMKTDCMRLNLSDK